MASHPPTVTHKTTKDNEHFMLIHLPIGSNRNKAGNHVTFCTHIRTERVRKLFIIFLILNEFSCSKMEIPCLYSQNWNI